MRGFSNPGSPGEEHEERTGGKRESGSEPWVRKGIQNFLVVYVEDHIQGPPRGEVDSNLELLSGFLIEFNVDRGGLGTGFVGVASGRGAYGAQLSECRDVQWLVG